jgi:predicted nucleic acid-binding protein
MKVMLDSDVLLDLILTRTPFDVDAALLWDAIQQKSLKRTQQV